MKIQEMKMKNETRKDKGIKSVRTMDDVHGDGSSHECCPSCGYCMTCGDCEVFGCGRKKRGE